LFVLVADHVGIAFEVCVVLLLVLVFEVRGFVVFEEDCVNAGEVDALGLTSLPEVGAEELVGVDCASDLGGGGVVVVEGFPDSARHSDVFEVDFAVAEVGDDFGEVVDDFVVVFVHDDLGDDLLLGAFGDRALVTSLILKSGHIDFVYVVAFFVDDVSGVAFLLPPW